MAFLISTYVLAEGRVTFQRRCGSAFPGDAGQKTEIVYSSRTALK
jgi:hypothetical protein